MRVLVLLAAVVSCSGCCSAPTRAPAVRYIVTLAVYPDKSCRFSSTARWRELSVVVDLKPTEVFLRTACHYFLARYEAGPVIGTPSSTESVGWYSTNPDVPLYIPNIEM